MAYSVHTAFDQFIERISLTGDHKETAEARRGRVVSLLEKTFDILDSFPIGSIPKGTALKTVADLDVLVVLHYSKHIKGKTPEEVLQAVRDALGKYRTNVRKNGQAVTLHYDSWPNVDIVPVSRTDNSDSSISHYNVPDMNTNAWLQARPRRHQNAITERETECGAGFRPLIRMIKEWNRQHSDFIESYHIEVLALRCMSGTMADYSWDVFQFFDNATPLLEGSLAYEGGYPDAYLDTSARNEVLRRVRTARDRARNAWHLTYGQNAHHEAAIEIWRQIFGDNFPAYG